MAPGLNLPAPKVATVEDVDEITAASTTKSAVSSSRFASKGGLIIPPPDIRNIVDKVATYVARNGKQFEHQIRADERGNSTKYAFLGPDHPYHPYYQSRIEAVTAAGGDQPAGSNTPTTAAAQAGADGQSPAPLGAGGPEDAQQRDEAADPAAVDTDALPRPRPLEFSADMPSVTAVDLDVIKLTALFTAQKGRAFATSLSAREKNSYQFEFLKPSHSLFGFFNALVEQYKLVLQPTPELIEYSRRAAFGKEEAESSSASKVRTGPGAGGGRMVTLDEVQKRADWEKQRREKRKKEQDAEAREKAAFDEIDWQDFVVVGTVELTEADQHIDLPPPTSLRTIENMTLAQQRMAAMIMDMEGSDNEEEAEDGQDGPARSGHLGALEERNAVNLQTSEPPAAEGAAEPVSAAATKPNAPAMKIRKDYVPKSLAQKQAETAATTKCPVCGQTVPTNEMGEHIRVELLNPRYREQRQDLENKKAQHNFLHAGADPMQALHRIAAARTDMFGSANDEVTQARKEEEEKLRAKEKEKIVWDGHMASKSSTKDKIERAGPSLEEQLQNIERKRVEHEQRTLGPQLPVAPHLMGSLPPPAPGMPIPPPPQQLDAGAVGMSAGPAAPSSSGPFMYPGNHMPPMSMPPPHGGLPYPPHHMSGVSMATGMKRPAEDELPGQPALQRMATEQQYGGPMGSMPPPMSMPMPPLMGPPPELTGPPPPLAGPLQQNADGTLHADTDWARDHPDPISLAIILPDAKNVSASCDGSTVVFEDLPMLTTTMGHLRERVQMQCLGGTVGAGRLKLKVRGGRATTQKQTLAYWNLVDGDEVHVTLK
ncbi:SF3a splicing factor complex subunit [Tilletia horrida]|uniref:SF3a splicing factor complex subunit n=1 Tax=Tilletia horrida TaxID=155126 RepID=A0AAN6JQZ3_9BASI|nr:SF3a splicing factor complex subunit [Tilletia horrida]KAK0560417.1 SF3a splicing factor complex subunit [Tilletia horrida]